jgi:hypothetical protein
VPRNDYLDEEVPDDEDIQGMPDDVDIPDLAADFPEEDIPACLIPSQPSRFPQQTKKAQVLGKPLFCALIDFTAAIYKIQNPRKNAWVLK